MSIQALQQLRDSDIQHCRRIAALEAQVAELHRLVEALRRPNQTLSLPARQPQTKAA